MKKPYTGSYVAHICKKCGCMFVAEDYTKATAMPPSWRYCKSCAEKMGINYETQTPRKNRTPEEQKKVDEKIAKLQSALALANNKLS